MKNRLLYILFSAFTSSTFSQVVPVNCIKTSGDCCVFANCITSDAFGNSYVTGWFNSNSITLGVAGSLKLSPEKVGGAMSLVKFNPEGKAIWARATSCTENLSTMASVTDKEGNSYVTGLLGNPFITDSLSKGFALSKPIDDNSSEMTVVKYDSKGNIEWLKKEGVNKKSTSIAIDKHKNVYISGFFTGDSVRIGRYSLKNPFLNEKAFFIMKYNNTGEVEWAKTTEGNGAAESTGIAIGPFGNIYLTGSFIGNVKFQTTSLTSHDKFSDIFLVKFNPNGEVLWAKSGKGNFSDYSTGITVDNTANVYISGYFSGNSVQLDETVLTNKKPTAGMDDFNIFIAKFDRNGNLIWGKNADDNGVGYPDKLAITSDRMGNCYLSGNFEGGHFAFGGKELKTDCPIPNNFILKMNSAGKMVWLKNVAQDGCSTLASFHLDRKQTCHAIIGTPQQFQMVAFKAH